MKETDPLTVMGDFSFDEKTIAIHPNDGFDLGLMMTENVAKIYYGASIDSLDDEQTAYVYGNVYLKNEVAMGQVEMSLKAVERLGKPKRVRLLYQPAERHGQLLVQPL